MFWLGLRNIIISYLSGRKLILNFNGHGAEVRILPGGCPQGTYLGGLFFIIKFNGALLRPPVPRPMLTNHLAKSKALKIKYCDDATVACTVNMKSALEKSRKELVRPLTFKERTEQILPSEHNLLQFYLWDTEKFSKENLMKINNKKTKVMYFSRSKTYDFPFEVAFSDNNPLELVTEEKLLGVIVTDDLKFQKNTDYICQKAMKKMWLLRRMKQSGFTVSELLDAYCKEVRSILELAVPVWHSSLTLRQSAQIERIQKTALFLILEHNYVNYDIACTITCLEPLNLRREGICLKFITKNLASDSPLLEKHKKHTHTRSQQIVKEFHCRTKAFQKSALPYLASLVNKSK